MELAFNSNTRRGRLLALLFFVVLGSAQVASEIGSDGLCPPVVFLPFTHNGTKSSVSILGDSTRVNTGFSHMAAAVLAVDHFNARDASVVPELSQEIYSTCNVSFDTSKSMFFDTESMTHQAALSLNAYVNRFGPPCAIAGPFNEIPAMGLSVGATTYQIPLVAHRSFNYRLGNPRYNPFASTVYPDLLSTSGSLTKFLLFKERTDFM
jgi:hypothetical protein